MNSLRHGLLARCTVLQNESREAFEALLTQYLERFHPADDVELGLVQEMVAAAWRMRRVWAIETRMLDNAMAQAAPPSGPFESDSDPIDRMVEAFTALADTSALNLLHRYETRLHMVFQRALASLLCMLSLDMPNEPSPISEQPAEITIDAQPLPPGDDDDDETES